MVKKPQFAEKHKLSIKEKLFYGLGDLSHGLAASAIGLWMLKYMTDVAGLGAYSAGLAVMIGRFWDSITDPLMGWITDHTDTRWGKRRPYLLFGAVPYALAFMALWMVPEFDGHQVSIFAYSAITLVLFNTCLTVVFVPYTTLTASITQDYNERTSLTGYRMAASQTGFLIGAVIPIALTQFVTSETGQALVDSYYRKDIFGSWAGTEREGYLIMGVLFGIIMIASILSPFFGTRERKFSDEQPSTASPFRYASSILDELQGNKPFRLAVCILLITNCATTLVAVILAYYLEYVLYMKDSSVVLFATLFISSILSMSLWVFLAKKYGKAETYRSAMACYAMVLLGLALLSPENTSLIFFVAVLAGIFNAAGLMIPWAIIPDIVEFDQLKKGKRREGLFYGGTTFCYKMATALAIFLSGWVLDLVGYVPNQEQIGMAKNGMRLLIGIIPALLLLIGAILSYRYPLTKERHELILKELETGS